MKYFVLTLTMFALLFNAAVAEATMVHNCSHHEAAAVEVQNTNTQGAEMPCHTEAAEKTTSHAEMQMADLKMAKNTCCGDVCLCIAKATLKTIDAPAAMPAAGMPISKKPILGPNKAAVDADLFAEDPPPKFFVA